MIIGILQCDSIRAEYRGQFDNYPQMFQALFRGVSADIETVVYDVEQGEYPTDIDDCDTYITTGSKASVYEDQPWIAALQAFIVRLYERDKKLVGVCFGHQLVAQALGGKTQKSEKGWGVGVHAMSVDVDKPWMSPASETVRLLVSHQDQVVALPTGAELIAGNAFCPHSMYLLNDSILCVQGHPEFNAEYAATMMRQRREAVGEAVFQAGMDSLTTATDEGLLAAWLVQFMRG